jgi:hypothetical protein
MIFELQSTLSQLIQLQSWADAIIYVYFLKN